MQIKANFISRSQQAPSPPPPPRSDVTPDTADSDSPSDELPPYASPFLKFINAAPTVYHAVDFFASELTHAGYSRLLEKDDWSSTLKPGGKYFVTRNQSSLIAFGVGEEYKAGEGGVAFIGSHIDALALKVKPVSNLPTKSGYIQLGVAPYAGAMNLTWWDRDLGLAGRVMLKQEDGSVKHTLVRLPRPIGRIPTLAPHFGAPSQGPFDKETRMTPVIGLEKEVAHGLEDRVDGMKLTTSGIPVNDAQKNHHPRLLKALAKELKCDVNDIVDLDLEMFDTHPGQPFGLDSEFLSTPRCDDKLCSYAAIQGLINATRDDALKGCGIVRLVGLFDDEEVGSRLRQGAASNFLPGVVERVVGTFKEKGEDVANLMHRTWAKSFFISADVIHAVNPNFEDAYEPHHSPRLNTGPVISCDPNGHMTTDAPSKSVVSLIASRTSPPTTLQLFQIRNGQPSGGTIGPMLSTMTGVMSVDMGLPQLSMHSIRATTGAEDVGLGVVFFEGFFREYEEVGKMVVVD
ncbi:hypothetical protein YB2330_002154 [Saitoella coloradoensis]